MLNFTIFKGFNLRPLSRYLQGGLPTILAKFVPLVRPLELIIVPSLVRVCCFLSLRGLRR